MSIVLFFIFFSFAGSVAVVWHHLNPFVVFICLSFSAAMAWLFRKVKFNFPKDDADAGIGVVFFKKRKIAIPLFLFLAILAFAMLLGSKSSGALQSPWQAINPMYLPIFFLMTMLLGFFLFSSHSVKIILSLIIVHSFVQHLYLPMSHIMPWGGDVWRHIAVEEKIMRGENYLPVLFGRDAKYRDIAVYKNFNVKMPEALLIPHKYTYGQFWFVTVFFARVFSFDLLTANRWLMPILWPVLLPILLFYIGSIIFSSRRFGLLLAALSAMSFPFQALGALALPVSFGFLVFLFAFLAWISYLATGDSRTRALAISLAFFMAFGYALYFLLIWFVIGASYFFKRFNNKSSFAFIAASIVFFPMFELIFRFSRIPSLFDFFRSVKQMIGQLSGWFYASAIRPHDIVSGNLFFNHTPLVAFVENVFTIWRWWIIPMMLVIWLAATVGLFSCIFERRQDIIWKVLSALFFLCAGGYAIGWYFLEGDRLFIRRIDLIFVFLALIFFIKGARRALSAVSGFSMVHAAFTAIFVFSFFTASTYASGPDMRVVSVGEYNFAKEVWNAVDKNDSRYCVIADTWPLLALESVSEGKIVGGGFPISSQFAQPDRVDFYKKISENNNVSSTIASAKSLTGASKCYVWSNGRAIEK